MLQVSGLAKRYGTEDSGHLALRDVGFDVNEGEIVSVVGPSGCGKTTLLKCVSGLMEPTSGDVTLQGAPVQGPPEGMAIVFQDYSRSLFPWLTVRENVRFPLRGKSLGKAEEARLVDEAIQAVGLTDAAGRRPYELSGGMQQRTAIARALAYRPKIMLMDEPFASVDAQTREDLEDLILAVRERFAMTVLLVTHDIDEATYISDRVVVLTPSPTEVRTVVDVDLPPQRSHLETKALPEFTDVRTRIYREVKSTDAEPTHHAT
ncbi:ABC transporter ATP-binding protein [Spiractinospora alimapuensis]|uniref:ABC transporter ATP-binding protein n=1 Tax=Spiractinospora alimapuensis TaxID=2820884 RepID=UPI001F36F0F9|nr:ABC transporter ATP-binding protein [Spiractinospora alimapuensis]QVQ54500.1 ABC transporter ATP-binding protein [Spiractinospora alimapuensis]